MSDQPRALLVEDERSWQELLSEILSDAGLAVDLVDTLEAARQQIHQFSYRLAVVDLSLERSDHRNRDGLKVLDALKQYNPGCASILLTGYATVEIAVSALTEHHAYTCLRKEAFIRSEFRELLHKALASPPVWEEAEKSPGESPPQTAVSDEAQASPEQAKMALVVEDDAGWRNIITELLSEAGYTVRACNGFGEALGALGRERYQLAVIDLSLSGRVPASPDEADFGGYRLLASTRANGIPAILVSGVARREEIERAYSEYGIFASLEKQTFDRAAFLKTVKEIEESGQLFPALEELTGRERQVLALIATGMTNKDIADTLVISTNTVKRHLKAIFRKLDVRTRAAATAKAINAGLSPPQTGG